MGSDKTTEGPAESPGDGMDRLTELFWHAEKTPYSGEWRVRFETAILNLMRIRNLPRPEAEKAAYQKILVDFLNDTMPAGCDPNSCLWCHRPEALSRVLIPLGIGLRTAWFHRECSDQWREARRADAVKTLAKMDIAEPCHVETDTKARGL
jgi:hypothetical protein